ncbi:hypothetical protein SmJEL517_g05200 [Synchytrium microbalum]|uniref:Uncharacterized protein n=1 Tax=Synchytrium microbalum TaxID=1806994 RepID=A0A507BQF9_9FUNG|nr:uncharacterized protein SmJEL517_g05200 [Synchytrium microbalum]TPX31467.1 hypothetical protein SmJEL517_g05200 [Synchytrium microbalum]
MAVAVNATADKAQCYFPDSANLVPGTTGYFVMYFGWTICIILAILSTIFTTKLVYKHFQHYNAPEVQRHIVRILMMVPIYSIVSTFQFRWFNLATVYELASSIYEAFVVWSFFSLMLIYVGDDAKEQHEALSKMPDHACMIPLNWIWRKKFSPRGRTFFIVSRLGVLQYVVVKPLTNILGIVLEYYDLLCPQSFAIYHGEFWVSGLAMISVSIAMYILLTFYFVVHEEIQKHNPLQKLLAVKFVVFLSFWQNIILGFLAGSNLLPSFPPWTPGGLAASLQSLLLCIEMFIAAVWHQWAFAWQEFLTNQHPLPTPVWKGFYDSLLFRDVVFDVARMPKEVKEHRQYKVQKVAGKAVNELYDNYMSTSDGVGTSSGNDDEITIVAAPLPTAQPDVKGKGPLVATIMKTRQESGGWLGSGWYPPTAADKEISLEEVEIEDSKMHFERGHEGLDVDQWSESEVDVRHHVFIEDSFKRRKSLPIPPVAAGTAQPLNSSTNLTTSGVDQPPRLPTKVYDTPPSAPTSSNKPPLKGILVSAPTKRPSLSETQPEMRQSTATDIYMLMGPMTSEPKAEVEEEVNVEEKPAEPVENVPNNVGWVDGDAAVPAPVVSTIRRGSAPKKLPDIPVTVAHQFPARSESLNVNNQDY